MDSLHLIEEAEEGPGLIQIWNIGKLNQALYVYRVMVFSGTFNNISVSWRSVLLVEVTEENHDLSQVTDKLLSHNVVSSTPHHERDSKS
jgi:hypothetical protein